MTSKFSSSFSLSSHIALEKKSSWWTISSSIARFVRPERNDRLLGSAFGERSLAEKLTNRNFLHRKEKKRMTKNKEDVVLRRYLRADGLTKIIMIKQQQSNTKFNLRATDEEDQARFKSKCDRENTRESFRCIQESNVDRKVIDVARTTSSHCSLIERVENYFHREKIPSNTETNLNKLQRITDDVKLLTKQLQRSIELNKNNSSSSITLGRSIFFFTH